METQQPGKKLKSIKVISVILIIFIISGSILFTLSQKPNSELDQINEALQENDIGRAQLTVLLKK